MSDRCNSYAGKDIIKECSIIDTELELHSNQISDVSPLSALTNLGYLNLSGNPITDWSPVVHIADVDGRP